MLFVVSPIGKEGDGLTVGRPSGMAVDLIAMSQLARQAIAGRDDPQVREFLFALSFNPLKDELRGSEGPFRYAGPPGRHKRLPADHPAIAGYQKGLRSGKDLQLQWDAGSVQSCLLLKVMVFAC